QDLLFRGSRPLFLGWRHDVGPRVFQHRMPQLALADELVVRLEGIERDIALFAAFRVAIKAILFENRFDLFAVAFDGLRVAGKGRLAPKCQHQHAGRPGCSTSDPLSGSLAGFLHGVILEIEVENESKVARRSGWCPTAASRNSGAYT